MEHEQATQGALGYAWGREDSGGTKTYEPPNRVGCIAFAEAYAQGWADYNGHKRYYMVNVRDAYETWQCTNGETIFRDEATACGPVPTTASVVTVR